MQRKRLLAVLAAIVVASVVVSAVGFSDTVYTWEKTFDVKKPEVECKIEIGDSRIVGCPVKVWVCLKLEDCCWGEWKDQFDDDWEDDCDDCRDWKDEWDDDSDEKWDEDWRDNHDHWECCCHVNGTYSVHLYWYNETSEDWEHVKHLQEEKNITITCFRYMQTYMFIPMWEGEYKVVVTLAVNSEIYNFTNEN